MIESDEELFEALEFVNEALQDIHNYVGPEYDWDDVRIRFPRGYLRTAGHFKKRMSFIQDTDVRDNLAYASIQTDVYLWLLNRTDLFGVAREMTIKAAIILLASINETLAVAGTKGVIGKNQKFSARCVRMVDKEIISEKVSENLQWLWNTRSAIHIYDLDHRELEKYTMRHFNRAVKTTHQLEKALANYHESK